MWHPQALLFSFCLPISVLAFLCASHLKKGLCAHAWLWSGELIFPLHAKGRTWALVDLQQVSLLKQREQGRSDVFAPPEDWG